MYPVQVVEVIVIGLEKIPENQILHKHQKQGYFIYAIANEDVAKQTMCNVCIAWSIQFHSFIVEWGMVDKLKGF